MFKRVKVKKGDLVVVTTGDSKGKQGRVVEVNRDNDRVVVEGVNLVKKHRKPSAQNPQGGIESIAAGINISNVKVVDAKGNATRVGRRRNADGKLERFSKKSGETLKKIHSTLKSEIPGRNCSKLEEQVRILFNHAGT